MSTPITGYRELSEGEIAVINKIKALGTELEKIIEYFEDASKHVQPPEERPDMRWVAIGRTHLQQGLMALTRAVAKPTSF